MFYVFVCVLFVWQTRIIRELAGPCVCVHTSHTLDTTTNSIKALAEILFLIYTIYYTCICGVYFMIVITFSVIFGTHHCVPYPTFGYYLCICMFYVHTLHTCVYVCCWVLSSLSQLGAEPFTTHPLGRWWWDKERKTIPIYMLCA